MVGVGIRELKTHLSEYLRRVERGATIRVTVRGRTIATIEPPVASREASWIREMAAEGRIAWSGGKPQGAARPHRLKAGAKTAADMVIEDRR